MVFMAIMVIIMVFVLIPLEELEFLYQSIPASSAPPKEVFCM